MSQHGREPLPPSWFEKNVDLIVRGVVGVCALLLVGDVVFHFVGHKHTHFDVEGWIGFYAVVGFVSYVGLVLTAKQLRKLVMRGLDYYGEDVPSSSSAAPGLAQSRKAAKVAKEEESESESEADAESDAEPEPEPEDDDEEDDR